MTLLRILRSGMMMTVQDNGRKGLLRSGVSRSGPMDSSAFAIANALVGNAPDRAALEFAYMGGSFEVTDALRIAVTGGAADIRIDGAAVPGWESHRVAPGQVVSVGGTHGAVWSYVAFSGGIETEPVLGSRATHLRTGVGGLDGRPLVEGDTVQIGASEDGPRQVLRSIWRRSRGAIRVIAGPQDDYFDDMGWHTFLNEPFSVSPRRDRMATMLEGPLLHAAKGNDIVSDGTLAGSIQVPGSGKPIVLMADRQTTGGYPKIATVASVDLPRLAQMPSGTAFRFQRISQEEGETLLIAERQALRSVIADLENQTEHAA